jgi:FMN phosphatase YigB (HAD superfamily)
MNAPTTQRAFENQPGSAAGQASVPDTVLPHELPEALDWFPDAKLLSLDCFDTLLWRDCHAPTDLFPALPGLTPMQRRWADSRARGAAGNTHRRSEVSIGEIYAQLMPMATPAQREAAITAELDAEARHCFAFAPTVALMRRAKAKGMPVILVSDTYLDAAQLRHLIERAAGPEVIALVDRIFVSSSHGRHKAQGLYKDVLRKLSVRPGEILHIGDNHDADVGGVAPLGVNTLHLKQFDPLLMQQLRLEAACSNLIHPIEGTLTAPQPHRATLAAALPLESDPAVRMGLSVLGPVLTGFDMWLEAEARQLAAKHGGRVHHLFLMRDGFMPMQVHKARRPDDAVHAIECSRFTAIGASFRRESDVIHYLETELGTDPVPLARQMLLPEADIANICATGDPQADSIALWNEMRKDARKKATVAASRALARRLVAHISAICDPQPGDVLMLIDVGYTGTVQNRIDAVLSDALSCHVTGRYLVLRETHHSGLDKAGFISDRDYDYQTLDTLCSNASVLDSFCTTSMGSVIDYTPEGQPIRRPNNLLPAQVETLGRIQQGILAFARMQPGVMLRGAHGVDQLALWRQASAATLTRTMFLPLAHELAIIAHFEHDINLGTDAKHALFDPSNAISGLRQRGLFHLSDKERVYLAGELHGHGLAPKLTFLTHKRFGLQFNFDDFNDRTVDVPVIFIDMKTGALHEQAIAATATHEGFFVAAVPLGDCRYGAALRFGQHWSWVELDSVQALPLADFLSNDPLAPQRVTVPQPVAEGIEMVTPRLMRCAEQAGFLMVNPPPRQDDTPMMLAVVFRPLADR